jgi:hypothetical protein
MSSKLVSEWLPGDEDRSSCLSTLSYMDDRVDSRDPDLVMESGGEPEVKATRLNSSVALRPDCVARALGLALEVVMEGSVAVALSSLGLLVMESRSDESLLCMRAESEVCEPIMMCCCVAGVIGCCGVNWLVWVVDSRDDGTLEEFKVVFYCC